MSIVYLCLFVFLSYTFIPSLAFNSPSLEQQKGNEVFMLFLSVSMIELSDLPLTLPDPAYSDSYLTCTDLPPTP